MEVGQSKLLRDQTKLKQRYKQASLTDVRSVGKFYLVLREQRVGDKA